ncbi:hypothetical protein [Pontibacillus marinus]|uniref:Uncharacterized protein n=1 Tax=Pontibacillus marinus BH030004 = DSM 16465 TaxID=1385511 RepID=A0A0A5GFF6_9BACI|nr:hypothetical protein [Pontibacillus marinus]KGX89938.1 hypothetical protein N783_03250 [Pontibacillus marinus BH030004 = DSM 16465]
MKPIYLIIPLFVVGIGLFTAQAAQVNEGSGNVVAQENNEEVTLTEGVDIVAATIEEMKGAIKLDPKNTEKLNQLGKKLDENWDLIEERVEETYPKDYKNIEDSLYPLIAESKKKSPNVSTLNKLIPETTDKLIQFKEKITQ